MTIGLNASISAMIALKTSEQPRSFTGRFNVKKTIAIVLVTVSVLAFALPSSAGVIYWNTSTTVDTWNRVDSAGGTPQTILSQPGSTGSGIAIDPTAGYMYSGDANHLFRTNLDGSGRVNLVSTDVNRGDVELDLVHGKVYWSTAWQSNPTSQFGIWRANLDGTGAEKIVPIGPLDMAGGIALDPAGGKMYWAMTPSYWGNQHQAAIMSANLDGTGVSTFRSLQVSPYPNTAHETFPGDVEIDPQSGKLFWSEVDFERANTRPNRIRSADLVGTGTSTLLSPSFDLGPWALAVDPSSGELYFSDNIAGPNHIYRMNYDGTGLETVLTDPNWIGHLEYADLRGSNVPEPASLVVWLIGGTAVMGYARLRRRRKGHAE